LRALSAVYGGVTRLRRSWYERRPESRLQLARPVVSVGNLVVGGSGKTPVVAAVASSLIRIGHRPAILSRGYRRARRSGDPVIVTDGSAPLVPVEASGDEPQMLARDLPGVPIVVAADRYRAGRVAIERFNSTVLILDDGFQHLRLSRTIDLIVVSSTDLDETVLPSGRLREPLAAGKAADAALVFGSAAEAQRVAASVGVKRSFAVRTQYLPLRALDGPVPPANPRRVVATAGIARPQRFFDALRQRGLDVVREMAFRDHHWFTARDVHRIEHIARELGAEAIITTAKDAVRLDRWGRERTSPWAILPMEVFIEPAVEFESWLRQRL
jgi:tetraacyldisaccharide 4'-kinase